MLTVSRRLGQPLLKRSTATANKAHADPATWAVNYNLQERDRLDNSINANRNLIHANHTYMTGRFDDHRQQMDGKLDEKLRLVDDKLDSALEKFIKSNDSLKSSLITEMNTLKEKLDKMHAETKEDFMKMKAETKEDFMKMKAEIKEDSMKRQAETKEDFHTLDKSVMLVSRSAALAAAAISLGLTGLTFVYRASIF